MQLQKNFSKLIYQFTFRQSHLGGGGKRCDVRLNFVRQFKTELVRRLECLVFEGKKVSVSVCEREREQKSNKTLIEHNLFLDLVR
jgi:hypothetical protein